MLLLTGDIVKGHWKKAIFLNQVSFFALGGSMGKKDKDAKKKAKDRSKVDERVKQISQIQPPDENPWKMENERKIDGFLRHGFKKKRFTGTIRQWNRMKKNKGVHY